MMPALLIGSEWLPNRAGGLNRYFHGLAGAAERAGVPARAVVTFLREGQGEQRRVRAMAAEGAGIVARLAGCRREARAALREGASLANPHFALYAWPWLRDLPRDVPLVVNFHGPWAGEMLAEARTPRMRLKAAAARMIERSVYRRADRCITLSQAFADELAGAYGVERSRITVVPGGADLGPFLAAPRRAEARGRLGLPENQPTVLSVRRITRRMGLDVLIEAAALVQKALPEVMMLIAGTGHAEAELEARIAERKLEGHVRLLGFVAEDDLPLLYAAADLSVLPSLALEGFGLAIVESMAAGTPTVGTPVGGIPEVLRPFRPGLISADATPQALGETLTRLLTGAEPAPDPDDCRRYAARFGWDTVFPHILDVWRESGARMA